MLNRSKIQYFCDTFLRTELLSDNSDNAYKYAFMFLDEVIATYYIADKELNSKYLKIDSLASNPEQSQNVSNEELKNLQVNGENQWNRYHRIQAKMNSIIDLVKHIEKGKASTEQAQREVAIIREKNLKAAFDAVYSRIDPEAKQIENENLKEQAGIEEISFLFSKVFAGGIADTIYDKYKPLLEKTERFKDVEKIAEIINAIQKGDIADFITKSITLIDELNQILPLRKKALNAAKNNKAHPISGSLADNQPTEAEIYIGEEITYLTALIQTLKNASNEAINLLVMEKKYARKNEEVSTRHVETKVDSLFREYLFNQLDFLEDINQFKEDFAKLQRTYKAPTYEFYQIAYQLCEKIITLEQNVKSDHSKNAERIKLNILKYHQTGATPPDFGVMNPSLIFSPKEFAKSNLYTHLSTQLYVKGLNLIAEKDIPAAPSRINEFWQRFMDGVEPSNLESLSSDHQTGAAINSYLKLDNENRFKVNNILDITKLSYALNQSVFNDKENAYDKIRNKRRTVLAESPANVKGVFIHGNSPVKAGVKANLAKVREFVNTNKEVIKALLTHENSSEASLDDLYFELNLSINLEIQEFVKEKYIAAVRSFPRNLLDSISKPNLETARITKLEDAMKLLTSCKSVEDYMEFFVKCNQLLNNFDEKLRWDGLYKDTIRAALTQVINKHILNPNKLTLNFSTEQLEIILKFLKANRMENDYVSRRLKALIDKRKNEEAHLSDNNKSEQTKALISNIENQLVKDESKKALDLNQAKVKSFKETVLGLWESNTLADIVISTGRFTIKDRDIGILASKLSSVISLVGLPYVKEVGEIVVNKMKEKDQADQLHDAKLIASVAAQCGGYQMMFNEIIASVVEELGVIFEKQIKHMHNSDEANRFAEFCFKRIYAALRMSKEERIKLHIDHLSIRDSLIAAVFLVPKDLNSVPMLKDHYRTVDDKSLLQSLFPTLFAKNTFQGMVNYMGLCTSQTHMPTHDVIEKKGKERQSRVASGGIKAAEGASTTIISKTLVKTDSIVIKGQVEKANKNPALRVQETFQAKLSKYNFGLISAPIAFVLGRAEYGLAPSKPDQVEEKYQVGAVEISKEQHQLIQQVRDVPRIARAR